MTEKISVQPMCNSRRNNHLGIAKMGGRFIFKRKRSNSRNGIVYHRKKTYLKIIRQVIGQVGIKRFVVIQLVVAVIKSVDKINTLAKMNGMQYSIYIYQIA